MEVFSLTLALPVLMVVAGVPAALADDALAAQAGCTDCHGADKQGTGPTYEEIASRYSGDAAARGLLIEKVATGGAGNWAEVTGGLSMPPYSNLLSTEEIRGLIDWILAQKGNDE